MKRLRVGVIFAASLAVATVAWAQKPDFSGTWTLDADASTPAGGGGGRGMGMTGPITVKQTAETLVVERQGRGGGTQTTTYKLDGSPSTVQMGQADGTATARWDGAKLVITTKFQMQDQPVEATQTWSLQNGTLTIERTGGRGPSKQVYKKST